MINLNTVAKALLIIVCCIGFNILIGMSLFKETIGSYQLGEAVFGGIGTGLMLTYLSNKKKRRGMFQSKL
jgi:hypothetical protein